MARMLGFSDEEKRSIGVAQQGGKSMVRGVLGLPGRVVGGLLKTDSSSPTAASLQTDNQVVILPFCYSFHLILSCWKSLKLALVAFFGYSKRQVAESRVQNKGNLQCFFSRFFANISVCNKYPLSRKTQI